MRIEGIFSVFGHVARGLTDEIARLDTVSENISNANMVASKGEPIYRRKFVDSSARKQRFQSLLKGRHLELRRADRGHLQGSRVSDRFQGEKWPKAKIIESMDERLVFDPTHPKADAQGYVRMPAINVVNEMMHMITSTRSYEANSTVLEAAKQIAKRTMEI